MKTKGNTGQRKQCRTALTHSYSSYSPHYKQTLVRHFNWILFADLKATVSLTSLWWEDGEGVYTTSPFISITSQDGGPPLREEGKLKKKRRGEEDYWDMAYIRFSGPGRGEGGERRDSRKKKGRCVSKIDLWGLDLLCSPHSIHRSDNKKWKVEWMRRGAECAMMGLMDRCVPGRVGALQY